MSRKNRYPGINPHLNSFLQHETGWKGFQMMHIVDIARLLDSLLPEGYYTGAEESLQINTYDRDELTQKNTIYPDVTIYQSGISASGVSELVASSPTMVLPVVENVEEEYISSVIVYRHEEPVTRIEVLSPANKHPGSDAAQYQTKRQQALSMGLCLVEVDYLHERRPIDNRIPSYRDRDNGATPYSIIVSDPRPETGLMKIYGFGILDTLPIVDIPLAGTDAVRFDFGAAYHQTFDSSRIYYQIRTDYTTEPVNFAAYAPDDQAKIQQHMALIAQQA